MINRRDTPNVIHPTISLYRGDSEMHDLGRAAKRENVPTHGSLNLGFKIGGVVTNIATMID